jgi:hypothetical protein
LLLQPDLGKPVPGKRVARFDTHGTFQSRGSTIEIT